jgi:Family of unknown function (DUF6263)
MRIGSAHALVSARYRALLWLLAVLIASLSMAARVARADEAEAFNLRPHWTAGQTARYEVWSSRTQQATVTLGGQSRSTEFNMTSEGEVTWTVDKVKADGSATCTMTMDWLTLDMTGDDGKKYENDSRKGKGDIEPFHALLKALAGVPIKVSVAADGTITKVDGIKAIRSRIKPELKDLVPEDLDFIETASDLATLVAAPLGAHAGKKWDADQRWTWSDPPFKGYMNHDLTFTLAGVEDMAGLPVAVVDGRSRLKLELDRSDLPEGMPPFDVKLVKGDLQTQIMFDLTRGEAVGRNTVQTTTIDINIRMPNATISRRVEQTLQGQVLRIEEE